MSKQLNLRGDEKFAEQLENLSKKLGRSMASVLETIARPAIEAAEADLQFEKGLITHIEAVMNACPYGMKPGWDLGKTDIA